MCQNGACYIILLLLSLAPDEKLAPFSLRLQTAFVSLVWVSQAVGLLLHAKGSCQKRFSGFCPLRGGVPPLSAKEKILLFFPLIFR